MRSLILCLSLVAAVGCGGSTPAPGGNGGSGGSGGGVGGNGGSAGSGGGGGGGSGGGGSAGDLALSTSGDMASTAGGDMLGSGFCCGQPGDKGNELGVGKYCTGFTECSGLKAAFCASLGDPKLHFCTMACQKGGSCGTGASCQCQGNQCGCVPDSCLNMPASC